MKFAMVSCAKLIAGFFNAYARLADRDDLQLLLHLGDYIYEASNTPPASQTPGADIGRPFDPLHECVTIDDYRTRYSQYHRDPEVQLLHSRHAIVPTLDDHEFADGAWRDGATEHKPEYGPWAQRRAHAFQAREEWLPIRRSDPSDPERVWRTVKLGALADLMLIDTRTRRDEPVPAPDLADPARSALGPEQREWLWNELERSTARWRLIANPSVMGQTWSPELPDDIRPALKKVKLIADDALTSQNLDDKMGWARHAEQSRAAEQRAVQFLPHWEWVDLDSHGYVVIDVTPDRLQAQFWHLDTVLERSPVQTRAAVWEVAHGSSRLTLAD